MELTGGKVIALYLDSGKKLVVTREIVQTTGGFLVRTGDRSVQIVPAHKVATVEIEYATKEEADEVFEAKV